MGTVNTAATDVGPGGGAIDSTGPVLATPISLSLSHAAAAAEAREARGSHGGAG